jgi:hypothetical protein
MQNKVQLTDVLIGIVIGFVIAFACGGLSWFAYSSLSVSNRTPEIVLTSVTFGGEEVRVRAPKTIGDLKWSMDKFIFSFTAPFTIKYQNLTGHCEAEFGFRMFADDRVFDKLYFDDDHFYEYKVYEVLPGSDNSRQITCYAEAPPLEWILSDDTEAIEPRPTIPSPFR